MMQKKRTKPKPADMSHTLAAELDALRLEAFSLLHKNDNVNKKGELNRLAERIDDLDNLIGDHCDLWAEAEVSSDNRPVGDHDEEDVKEEVASFLREGSWFHLLKSYFLGGTENAGLEKKWDQRRHSEPFLLLAVMRTVDGLMVLDDPSSTKYVSLCLDDARRSIEYAKLLREGFVSEDARGRAVVERQERARLVRQQKARKAAGARHGHTDVWRAKIHELVARKQAENSDLNLSQIATLILPEYEHFVEVDAKERGIDEPEVLEMAMRKYIYRTFRQPIVPAKS